MVVQRQPMRRWLQAWLAVWAGWTALALFFAVSNSLTYVSTGRPANWALTIKPSLSEWWLWALLTPFVVLARAAVSRCTARDAGATSRSTSRPASSSRSSRRRPIAPSSRWLTGFWMYWLVSTLALHFVVYGAIVAAGARRRVLPAQPRARAARGAARRDAAAAAQHAAAAALPVQHAEHDRGAGPRGSRRPRPHDRRPERSAAPHAGARPGAGDPAARRARPAFAAISTSRRPASATGCAFDCRSTTPPGRLACRRCCSSRSSRTRFATASQRTWRPGGSTSRRADWATSSPIAVTDDGAGVTDESVREGVGLGNTRARLEALYPARLGWS